MTAEATNDLIDDKFANTVTKSAITKMHLQTIQGSLHKQKK